MLTCIFRYYESQTDSLQAELRRPHPGYWSFLSTMDITGWTMGSFIRDPSNLGKTLVYALESLVKEIQPLFIPYETHRRELTEMERRKSYIKFIYYYQPYFWSFFLQSELKSRQIR